MTFRPTSWLLLASLVGVPLMAGCGFDEDEHHHDRDWGRPAGYEVHDRDWDRDHARYDHDWDRHHDRDWDRD